MSKKDDEAALGDMGAHGLAFDVEVNTNMCECLEQGVVTEVCRECGKLRYRVNDEINPDHYGPYGANCMNTGQFDAGECWICAGKRKQFERNEAQEELAVIQKKLIASNDRCTHLVAMMDEAKTEAAKAATEVKSEWVAEAAEARERYDAVWEQSEQWEEQANANKNRSGEMQLVAGRYQFQFERAMRCINSIDDMFEYRFRDMSAAAMQTQVRVWLKEFTDAVSIPREIPLKED